MSGELWLTDQQWQRLAPLLPSKLLGVPRVDDRRVINGLIHVLCSGGCWIDAPVSYGVSIRRGPRQTYFVVLRWISMRLRRLSIPNWEKAMVPS
ncbi:hypothetical protein HMPREF9946_04441 [Acetobacteraceae bacterium AT-5844]|nr:hypothetical protein HMPREF9946_04441 [Acetobacteraceae bacterium AT-5844]